jgi:hypothetical protein
MFSKIVQGMNTDYNYFKMHIAASKISHIYNISPYSESSKEDPHYFHYNCPGWNGDCIVSSLFTKEKGYVPKIIKLSSSLRETIDHYINLGAEPSSIFSKYISK